jgi:hypothetical protein
MRTVVYHSWKKEHPAPQPSFESKAGVIRILPLQCLLNNLDT